MALTDLGAIAWPFDSLSTLAFSTRTKQINASGERVGWVLSINKTGSITDLGFVINAIGTADDVDIRLETVTQTLAANYEPSGTLWSANTSATITGASLATGYNEATLTSSASVTEGDIVAVVLQFTGDTTSTGDITIYNVQGPNTTFPMVHHRTGGSWGQDFSARPVVGLSYSGTYYQQLNGASFESISTATVSSGLDHGTKFTIPVDANLKGVSIDSRAGSGSFLIRLQTSAQAPGTGTTILTSREPPFSNNQNAIYWLNTPQSLTAGTTYRITIDSTVNANPVVVTYGNSSIIDQDVGPNLWHYTVDNGAGGWTDSTDKNIPAMYLILDKVQDTSGGGGGTYNIGNMRGGFSN